jgi:hypothetical protein
MLSRATVDPFELTVIPAWGVIEGKLALLVAIGEIFAKIPDR